MGFSPILSQMSLNIDLFMKNARTARAVTETFPKFQVVIKPPFIYQF